MEEEVGAEVLEVGAAVARMASTEKKERVVEMRREECIVSRRCICFLMAGGVGVDDGGASRGRFLGARKNLVDECICRLWKLSTPGLNGLLMHL